MPVDYIHQSYKSDLLSVVVMNELRNNIVLYDRPLAVDIILLLTNFSAVLDNENQQFEVKTFFE